MREEEYTKRRTAHGLMPVSYTHLDVYKRQVYTLCPVQNRDQPTWEQGARNLIFGFVLAMCEDCIKGKIDESQLVLFNVYHNITKYCSEDTTALRNYLIEGRDEFSKVKGLVNTVLITSDKTLTRCV